MRNHDGSACGDEQMMFAEAPPEIGKVLSVGGTLGRDGRVRVDRPYQWLNALRLVPLGMGAGAILAFGVLAVMELFKYRGPPIVMMYGLAVGTLASLVAGAMLMRRVPECTYVGELGVARFRRRGARVIAEVLEFRHAVRVEQSSERLIIQRGYEGTVFGVLWQGPENRRLFLISGRYDDRKTIPSHNARHFAVAALAAWEAFRNAQQPGRVYG